MVVRRFDSVVGDWLHRRRYQLPGKTRVHDLAKELGKSSKEVMTALTEMGVYVKSPSSAVDAAAVRMLRHRFSQLNPSPRASQPPGEQAFAKFQAPGFLDPLPQADKDAAVRQDAAAMFGVSDNAIRLRGARRPNSARTRSRPTTPAAKPPPITKRSPGKHHSPAAGDGPRSVCETPNNGSSSGSLGIG